MISRSSTYVLHVSPMNDVIEHDMSTCHPDCVCGPRVEPVTRRVDGSLGWMIIHHSLDGREKTE